ncbi:TPR-like protein [Peniophora sp. CONT]|nr:TPR-like protein [Peniophora sp. CONT]
MSNPKEKHYWSTLRHSLTSGSWNSSTPAKAYNGTPISWSELFRKFNKHCPGYGEVVEVASQTQAIALLVAGGVKDEDLDGVDGEGLDCGEECVVDGGRRDEAKQAYEALKSYGGSEQPSDSRHLALAYAAYALTLYTESLSHLSAVRDLAEAQSRLQPFQSIRSAATTSTSATTTGNSTTTTGNETSGSSFVTNGFTSSFVSLDTAGGSGGDGASIAEISNGNTWAAAEVIRSVCLQGMCIEKTSSDPSKALEIYLTATLSLPTLLSSISSSAPAPTTQQFASFVRYRELWRWVERVLYRAICLASRSCELGGEKEEVVWTLFGLYQNCAAHWPPTFRPHHRTTIAALHVRSLILKSRLPSSSSSSTTSSLALSKKEFGTRARRVIREVRDVIGATTTFPRADQRNRNVEDLVDLAVASWQAAGAEGVHAGWVMDILWWATRLTFNSPLIYRHLTYISHVSSDNALAIRTLRLYIAVVGKSREAGEVEGADSDGHWVDTLVEGARMLCRVACGNGEGGVDEVREALSVLDKAEERLDENDVERTANVALARGIALSVLAEKEADHLTRPTHLTSALNHLERSISLHPTPSAHHHLALALSRPIPGRDLDRAIENARAAVEGDARQIRYWHLLGLLLVANEDLEAARGVLDVAIQLSDADDEDGDDAPSSAPAHVEPVSILPTDATSIPPSSTLLTPLPSHPPPTPSERFAQATQIRMSSLALTELADGAEGAGERWVEVFAWFAERSKGASGREVSRRGSVDTARSRAGTTVEGNGEGNGNGHVVADGEGEVTQVQPDGLPPSQSAQVQAQPDINITPPSPGATGQTSHSHSHSLSNSNSHDEDRPRRSSDSGGTKKVQRMLQDRVSKGSQRVSSISKKMASGVTGRGRRHASLHRTNSLSSEFYAVQPYQASSIHSRRTYSPFASMQNLTTPQESSPPIPPPPPSTTPIPSPTPRTLHQRALSRLLSDLWLQSSATFRRAGKPEQARSAIQEAEVLDEDNPGVWVQLGLSAFAQGQRGRAVQALNKALFIHPSHVGASVHLAQVYLSPFPAQGTSASELGGEAKDDVDLAVGILSDLTKGEAWDVPEAWLLLARGHKARGEGERERECLGCALGLVRGRGVRDLRGAVGVCL